MSKILEYSQEEKMGRIEAQVDDNIDIIIYLITEFNNTTDTYDFEDLLQVGFLGMLKAINKFDESKGELRDYIFCSVRNSLIKFLRKELQVKIIVTQTIPIQLFYVVGYLVIAMERLNGSTGITIHVYLHLVTHCQLIYYQQLQVQIGSTLLLEQEQPLLKHSMYHPR